MAPAGSGITLNVAHPGQADTAILQSEAPAHTPALLRWLVLLLGRLVPRGEATVVRAARCSIFLAADPSVAEVSGGFFMPNTRRGSWPAVARDPREQQLIWDNLEQLVARRPLV